MASTSLLPRGHLVILSAHGEAAVPLPADVGVSIAAGATLADALALSVTDPDVVLLTDAAGADTALAVRAHPRARRARLILITARGDQLDPELLAETVDVVLETPVSSAVLQAVLARQLREREREAAAEARHLREVADASPLPVWMLDDAGRPVFVSRAWRAFTGLAHFQPGDDPWSGRVHADDAAPRAAALARAMSQRLPFQVEYRLRRHDGVFRIVEDHGLPHKNDRGQFVGYVGGFLDVTDQRQAREVMRARAQFNQGAFDSSSEPITLIGLDGQVLMINPAGLRALRLEAQEQVAGRPWPSLWAESDQAEAERALARARRGRVARFRGVVPVARGEPRWWDVVLSPMYERGRAPDQIVAIARDITDVKRAEAESRRLLHEQTALLESTGEGIFGVDLAGHCTFINSSALAELGYSQDEALGQDMHALLQPRHADGALVAAADSLITRTLCERRAFRADDQLLRRKDGTAVPVECSVHPILVDEQVTGAVVAFRNITERRRAEAEREQLLAAEQAARVAAEGAVAVRNAVLATVSHDLKNPITAIKGTAQLLQRMAQRVGGPEGEQLLDGLHHIDATTTRMVSLINELADVVRLRAGQPLELRRRQLDLTEVAVPNIEATRAATETHTITFETVGDRPIGSWDAERLERVIANLLANAVKYSPRGSTIACRLETREDTVQFSVRDQGVGIPAADLPLLFRPFHRGANVRDAFPGTGLGLAGARHIIHAHGGDIAVVSVEGRGTTVTFTLPLTPPDAEEARAEP